MSDSDDTDILLLIPPDFFLAEGSSRDNSATGDLMSFSSIELPQTIKARNSSHSGSIISSQHNHLLRIDRQIADLERNPILSDRNPYTSLSDRGDCQQWTANNSYDTDYCTMNGTSPIRQLNHSTPKQAIEHNGRVPSTCSRLDFGATQTNPCYDEKFLKEIDYYLGDNNSPTTNTMPRTVQSQPLNNVHSVAVETLKRHNSMLHQSNYGRQSGTENNLHSIREINVRQQQKRDVITRQHQAEPLVSLSDIWGPEGESETVTMHEERLRRQHCEREIQVLQARLLEYQQKIAVAMKIDKSKDEAISRLQHTNSRYFVLKQNG